MTWQLSTVVVLLLLAIALLAAAHVAHWHEHDRESRARSANLLRQLEWMRTQEAMNLELYRLDRAMWAAHGMHLPAMDAPTVVPQVYERAFREERS